MQYMGPNAADIVGYDFNTEHFHPHCIIAALPTGPGGAFDGWALAADADPMSVEEILSEIAAAFGIERMKEDTFDSGDFPKVVFGSQVESSEETCAACREPLID